MFIAPNQVGVRQDAMLDPQLGRQRQPPLDRHDVAGPVEGPGDPGERQAAGDLPEREEPHDDGALAGPGDHDGNQRFVPAIRRGTTSGSSSPTSARTRAVTADCCVRSSRCGTRGYPPAASRAATNAPTAVSMSSKVCAADSWTRMRASPFGTTGKENATA